MSWPTSPPPRVYLVLPTGDEVSPEQDKARLAVQRHVEDLGWSCLTRRTRSVRALANNGRQLAVIEPVDAHDIYVAAHKAPTAVLVMGPQPLVLVDPSDIPHSKNLITVERLLRYKAFLGRFGVRHDPTKTFADFTAWTSSTACDGERDARTLPLHVFSPSRDWPNLAAPENVASFETVHGPALSRSDDQGRPWAVPKPGAMHGGRGAEYVAGVHVRPAFHWDVSAVRGGRRRVTNAREVWMLEVGRYCNIYPNSTIRNGGHGVGGRLVFEAERPATVETTIPQRPSNRRKRRGRPHG